jgi:hypothetical protein
MHTITSKTSQSCGKFHSVLGEIPNRLENSCAPCRIWQTPPDNGLSSLKNRTPPPQPGTLRPTKETMMQYIALIYSEETGAASPELIQEYGKFTQDIIAKGQFKAGDALQSSSTATCVSVRNGKTVIKDGPFSETKEQLGGYYLLECANLDDAIEAAAKIPTARVGTIEVRPVMNYQPGGE